MKVEKRTIPPKPQEPEVEYIVILTQGDVDNLSKQVGAAPYANSGDALFPLYKTINIILKAAGKGYTAYD